MATTTSAVNQVHEPRQPYAKRSCTFCAHLPVCTVYRALTPLLEKWTDDTRPFDAADIANICKTFYPASVAKTLNGA
jgi:hypothetical protein